MLQKLLGFLRRPAAASANLDFLLGGGEMGGLMRSHDWSGSPLGPPHSWPQSLKTVVRIMLNTGHPMYIWWGPQLVCLYNDAYRESIGPERHPGSLGQPAHAVWEEIWHLIHPQIEQVMSGGGATWNVDQLVPITRHGQREDVYWTYSYSPIDDETAPKGIGGVLVVCSETTRQVLAARQLTQERNQLAQLFDASPTFMVLLRGPTHRVELANPGFMKLLDRQDVLGRPASEVLPDAIRHDYLAQLDRVFAFGEPYAAASAKFPARAEPGQPASERVLDLVLQPINDAAGGVSGIFVQGADVTSRAMAEAALRESETRFRAALVAGRMGSWETDYPTMTRKWSAEGMALFGLALPDGRGRVGGPADEYVGALHPDDRHLAEEFHALADRQDSFPAEYRIVRPDGRVLWLSGRGLVVEREADGKARRLISIMADATERMEAQEQLRIEHERLDQALASGHMGVYDMNIRDDVLWWHAQTYKLFGVEPATFVPTPESVMALLHPEDRATFSVLRAEAIARREPFFHEFRVQRPDGTQAWLGHHGQAEYDADGRPVRNFGITMDITERKHAEGVLRDADRKKDHFMAVLAHELRNPLAPIRNAIQLLRRVGAKDRTSTWCHDIIDRQVTQMAHLLDDLLDASRLSRGQLRLRLQRMNLATAIEQAIEIARPPIDAAGHAFKLDMPAQPMELEGDLTRLAQVFSNVLINAAKYTPAKGEVALTVERQGDQAIVTVRDTGVGIAAEYLERIFEMFGQVESSWQQSQGGQGIGLALARGLIEMHGGSIRAASEGAGKGSEFTLRLPLLPVVPAMAEAAQGPPAGEDGLAVESRRIVVADDLRDAADTLAAALQAMGHTVDVAYDGEQALQLVAARQPEVVLLDLGMPRIDGYEVCRRIRAAPGGDRMLVLAQTGWGQAHDHQRTRDAGFDHHLVKPVDLQALATLLDRRAGWGPGLPRQ